MAVKILSVDDEADLELLLSQYFRRQIRKGEYEFLFAHNGMEALSLMAQHPDVNIILSDINMPEMDGLTLLAKINEMRNPAIKVVMVSAYGDMGNIRHAMNNGAFDFTTKPIDLEDLDRTIRKAAQVIEFVRQSQEEHTKLTDIEGDLSVARVIQHAILPQTFQLMMPNAERTDIFASMVAAKDVGGDFYDFFRIDDEQLGFIMADVSGKGIPAAIFMAMSRTLIKTNGLRGIPSNECMRLSNDMLCGENVNNMFVTAFHGIYNLRTGTIDYTNAGHNPPYVLHADGRLEMLPVQNGNIVLGAINGISYQNATITLQPGDALYMFTDGVTEAENPQHDLYGEERLEALLSTLGGKTAEEIAAAVSADVHQHAGTAEQSDDITQLVIRRK